MNMAQMYSAMSAEDKAALKELKIEEEKRLGRIIPLSDIIAAVTPGMANPAYLADPAYLRG